jgi:hypothetical protein
MLQRHHFRRLLNFGRKFVEFPRESKELGDGLSYTSREMGNYRPVTLSLNKPYFRADIQALFAHVDYSHIGC